MDIFFTAAEYNPFHKGHEYHIAQARANGATHIAAVMSGNFVQRGEPAILPKTVRAAAAVAGGVDLVLDLPSVWALAPAERFAAGCADIALGSGVANGFTCGCETADLDLLQETARLLSLPETQAALNENRLNCSYPAAVAALCGEKYADVLSGSNNILAVEYIKALHKRKADIRFLPIERKNVQHDSDKPIGDMASAGYIRQLISAEEDHSDYIPTASYRIIQDAYNNGLFIPDASYYERQLLAMLRQKDLFSFLQLPGGNGGMGARLASAVKNAASLDELYFLVKTKRFTLSSVRRLIMCACLGINEDMARRSPPYIRVLAMNVRGREILREMRKKATLPIVMKKSDVDALDTFSKKVYAFECVATDVYNTFLKNVRSCSTEMTDNISRFGV